MLNRIDAREAMFELLNGSDKIYYKSYYDDSYQKAIDGAWSFNGFGSGRYYNETEFFIEIEDADEL